MSKIDKYAFSDLYSMSSGISSSKEQAGHGSPFVSFSTVFNNYFLPDTLTDLMNTSEKEQKTYSLEKDDILITRTSETIDELAMSCVVLKDYPQATYSGFTKRLRPTKKNVAYSKYMAFYLRGYLFRKAVTNNAFMTLRASFNEDIFSFLNLYLPEYKVQQRIGNLLYDMERKIALNNRTIAELEAMAQTIYDYWFVQFDFPNAEGKPYRQSGGEMEYNETLKREIPKGWRVELIGNLLDKVPNTTKTITTDYLPFGKVPVIDQSTDFIAGYVNDYTTKLSIDGGGIVFGDHTRIVKYIGFDFARGADGTQVLISNNKNEMPQLLLFQVVKSIDLSNYGYARHFKFLKEQPCVVPNDNIAQSFNEAVESIYKDITHRILGNLELTRLRDWLLPMLMNGQATVE